MKLRRPKEDNNQDNIFWVTMTDLMTALVLVFIVLFFYTYMTSYFEKIQSSISAGVEWYIYNFDMSEEEIRKRMKIV